ncbi:MAG TPA: 23S rRNA (uracil(1939)-C(5))-methyltransferase RlmD [Terriglobia bacterium]|nr:23S rRNA (uracil(1939)-C(5))-methyltransferase RlmD [Terriglobia bacterium]
MFEFTPQKLVYGGEALGHYQGRTVLVTGALPGERLEVEEVRTAKGVVHARPLQVLEAAAERVDPPCPYFGCCGGCQYQHLHSERQTDAKREILRETLRRIGGIAWDGEILTHTAHPWNYRNQAQFKLALQADGGVELGFFEAGSHRLLPVESCLIVSPRLNATLHELRGAEWSEHLAPFSEIELLADARDEEVSITLRAQPGGSRALDDPKSEELGKRCLDLLPGVTSVGIERGRSLRVFGKPALTYAVGHFSYQVSHGSFFQASRFLLTELVRSVTSGGLGDLPKARLALDLFAGVGLLTLPLAGRFEQVIAVEANAQSAHDLATNARAFPNVRAVTQPVFDFLRRFAQAGPDLVVLDPPRAGVGFPTLKLLAALRPQRVHYVSCHPPTLARDLAYLIGSGYRLDSVEMFDFFPQTFHIESLARLSPLG